MAIVCPLRWSEQTDLLQPAFPSDRSSPKIVEIAGSTGEAGVEIGETGLERNGGGGGGARERDRDRDRETESERERQTEERQRDRHRERQTDRDRQ